MKMSDELYVYKIVLESPGDEQGDESFVVAEDMVDAIDHAIQVYNESYNVMIDRRFVESATLLTPDSIYFSNRARSIYAGIYGGGSDE